MTDSPEWMSRVGGLSPAERRERYEAWYAAVRRPTVDLSRARHELSHAVEQLRDAVAEARAAGLTWTAIAEAIGLDPEAAGRLLAD